MHILGAFDVYFGGDLAPVLALRSRQVPLSGIVLSLWGS
jgi:hypothetical protein